MSLNSAMSGSFWHVEILTKEDEDPRRHKTRCIYYQKNDNHCTKIHTHCTGSAHCFYYDEGHHSDDPMPWGEEEKDYTKKPFEGVQMVGISEIHVDKFRYGTPNLNNVSKLKEYYAEHGELDKPVLVSCHGMKYRLEDHYLQYYVAEQLCLDKVPAEIEKSEREKAEERIRNIGTRIKHAKYGYGTIKAASEKYVTIQFESGETKKFDIAECIDKGLIKPVP